MRRWGVLVPIAVLVVVGRLVDGWNLFVCLVALVAVAAWGYQAGRVDRARGRHSRARPRRW